MKKTILVLTILLTVLFLFGCIGQGMDSRPMLWIYKTSEDYNSKVCFLFTENNEIGFYPVLPSSSEVKVSNGYFYSPGLPLSPLLLNYIVVTDIELNEFQSWKQIHNSPELKEHIIDMHPFEEAYLCDLRVGLTPDWEDKVPQITQSLSVGEIPIECEKATFTPRAGEQE